MPSPRAHSHSLESTTCAPPLVMCASQRFKHRPLVHAVLYIYSCNQSRESLRGAFVFHDCRPRVQVGSGHMSVLGAYEDGSDQVLILDVARYKYPPHWVPAAALFDAMRALAGSTSRGWVVVSVPPGGSALPPGGPPMNQELNIAAIRECAGSGDDPYVVQLCLATGGTVPPASSAASPGAAPAPATSPAASVGGMGGGGGGGGGGAAVNRSSSSSRGGGGGDGGIWAAWLLAAALGGTSAALAYELRRERAAAAALRSGGRGDRPLLPEAGSETC